MTYAEMIYAEMTYAEMTYAEFIRDFTAAMDAQVFAYLSPCPALSLIDAAAGLVPLRPYLSTADALAAIDTQHAEEARQEARDAALVRAIGRMG